MKKNIMIKFLNQEIEHLMDLEVEVPQKEVQNHLTKKNQKETISLNQVKSKQKYKEIIIHMGQ